MSILESLLQAYVAPEMAAQKQQEYERGQGKRDADAWQGVLDSIKPKPDVAGSLYSAKEASGNNVLNALTQSAPAKQAHEQLAPKMSPSERIKAQLDAMMLSGNQSLQKRALQEIGKPGAVNDKMSNSARIATDIGLTPGTPAFNQFVQSHAMKAGTTVNMGGKAGNLSKDEKVEGNLDPEAPFVWGKNGIPSPVKTSAFTEAQQKAQGFADRMQSAETEMAELMASGFDPTTIQQKVGEKVPYIGSHIQTGEQQLATRLQRDWIRSKLRDESGATINVDEMESEIETYFPQPGDGPIVMASKARARLKAAEAMKTKSGKFQPYSQSERKALRDIVKKDIEKARATEKKSMGITIPDGWEIVED